MLAYIECIYIMKVQTVFKAVNNAFVLLCKELLVSWAVGNWSLFVLEMFWPLHCTRCAFPWSQSSFITRQHPPPTPKSLYAPHLAMNDSPLLLFLSESKELGEKAVLPSQSTTLISPRCITPQKPCIPYTHLFVFFSAVILSIDCLCFWMFVERPWGL